MGVTTEEVIATKVIDGVTCYQIEITNDYRTAEQRAANEPMESGSVTYFWEYHNRNGSYDFSDYDTIDKSISPKSLDEFNLTLPYPVKSGFRYQSSSGKDWKILSTGAKVKTSIGVYECVVYQLTEMDAENPEDSSRFRFYMTPGVGLVAFEWDEYINGRFSTWLREVLVGFDLNEAETTSKTSEKPE